MIDAIEQLTDPIQIAVEELIQRGKKCGFVTWEEMNEILPDDAIDPAQLEMIMMRLEVEKIETLDEIDAQRYVEERRSAVRKRGGRKWKDADLRRDVDREVKNFDVDVFTVEAGVKRIDDPVRMYLTQMGEIPLLTRAEEIRLAKKIELTRMAFRQKVLESDYCTGLATEVLQQVHEHRLPFDRTVKISTSEHAAKARISARIPVNLTTARKLMAKNEDSWQELQRSRLAAAARSEIERGMRERRRKISKLLEELSLILRSSRAFRQSGVGGIEGHEIWKDGPPILREQARLTSRRTGQS